MTTTLSTLTKRQALIQQRSYLNNRRIKKHTKNNILIPLITLILILQSQIISTSSRPFGTTTTTTTGKLYKTLGLCKDCTQDDIKKSYRRLALRYHPDKVPSEKRQEAEKKFKSINKAYETLSNEEKRKLYDDYDEQSLDSNFNPSTNNMFGQQQQQQQQQNGGFQQQPFGSGNEFSFDGLFGSFASEMGGPQTQNPFSGSSPKNNLNSIFESILKQKKNASQKAQRQNHSQSKTPTVHNVYCTLEEIAMGCAKKLKVTFPILINNRNIQVEKVYTIPIKPGWKSGTKIHFPSSTTKKHQEVTIPAITFIIQQKKHAFLQRENNDLIWKCKLNKRQAEHGAKLTIPLPTGETFVFLTRDYSLKGGSSEIILKGSRMELLEKGMPMTYNSRGKLIVEFDIIE